MRAVLVRQSERPPTTPGPPPAPTSATVVQKRGENVNGASPSPCRNLAQCGTAVSFLPAFACPDFPMRPRALDSGRPTSVLNSSRATHKQTRALSGAHIRSDSRASSLSIHGGHRRGTRRLYSGVLIARRGRRLSLLGSHRCGTLRHQCYKLVGRIVRIVWLVLAPFALAFSRRRSAHRDCSGDLTSRLLALSQCRGSRGRCRSRDDLAGIRTGRNDVLP